MTLLCHGSILSYGHMKLVNLSCYRGKVCMVLCVMAPAASEARLVLYVGTFHYKASFERRMMGKAKGQIRAPEC